MLIHKATAKELCQVEGKISKVIYTLYDLIYYNFAGIMQIENSLVNAEGEAWEGIGVATK